MLELPDQAGSPANPYWDQTGRGSSWTSDYFCADSDSYFDVCYFRFGNPAGFVIHEPATKSYQSVLISVGPFLVNTTIGAIVSFPAAIPSSSSVRATYSTIS